MVQIRHIQVTAEVCYQDTSSDALNGLNLKFPSHVEKKHGGRCRFCVTGGWLHESGPFILSFPEEASLKRCLCSTSSKTKWPGQNTKLPNWNEESYYSVLTLSVHKLSLWHDCQWWVFHLSEFSAPHSFRKRTVLQNTQNPTYESDSFINPSLRGKLWYTAHRWILIVQPHACKSDILFISDYIISLRIEFSLMSTS